MGRLGKLCELVLSARASERWNDLSLLQRQIEDNASQTVSAIEVMREKLQVLVARVSDSLRASLAAMRIVFLASLAASLFIALGMWFVWKRFEESILGISFGLSEGSCGFPFPTRRAGDHGPLPGFRTRGPHVDSLMSMDRGARARVSIPQGPLPGR